MDSNPGVRRARRQIIAPEARNPNPNPKNKKKKNFELRGPFDSRGCGPGNVRADTHPLTLLPNPKPEAALEWLIPLLCGRAPLP